MLPFVAGGLRAFRQRMERHKEVVANLPIEYSCLSISTLVQLIIAPWIVASKSLNARASLRAVNRRVLYLCIASPGEEPDGGSSPTLLALISMLKVSSFNNVLTMSRVASRSESEVGFNTIAVTLGWSCNSDIADRVIEHANTRTELSARVNASDVPTLPAS